jgi:integrase
VKNAKPTTAKKKKNQPLEEVKIGGHSVFIYNSPTRKNGKEYPGFILAWTANETRQRKFYSNLETARLEAKAKAKQLGGGTAHLANLSLQPVSEYDAAIKALRRHSSANLVQVVTEWAACMDRLNGTGSLLAATDTYLAELAKIQRPGISVSDAVIAFLDAKDRAGMSDRYITECRLVLKKFQDAFRCNIAGITTSDLAAYIDRLKLGTRSKNNHRQAIVALFSFARRRGYLDRDKKTEAEHLEPGKEPSLQIQFYKPQEAARIIEISQGLGRLAVGLGAFAGLRSSEMMRLAWKHIGPKYITINADSTKTANRRLVPILPPLAKILDSIKKKEGKVFDYKKPSLFSRFLLGTIEAAGIDSIDNGLRHSFCTYRLAAVQSAAQVALEMGNSSKVIFKNYRELATPEEAEIWFSTATTGKNLVPLKAA